MIPNRYGKANNTHNNIKWKISFNPEKSTIYLPYIDANNLYSMCKLLLVGYFQWMDRDELKDWKICHVY